MRTRENLPNCRTMFWFDELLGIPRAAFCRRFRTVFGLFKPGSQKKIRSKAEYFLPSVVSSMIEQDGARVKVMTSHDRWYGVTYPQDKQTVVQAFEQMSEQGLYPQPLWQE